MNYLNKMCENMNSGCYFNPLKCVVLATRMLFHDFFSHSNSANLTFIGNQSFTSK